MPSLVHRGVKKSFWSFFGRAAIAVALYPWLVSFDSPGDSLSHTLSIYGSDGSYTHVTLRRAQLWEVRFLFKCKATLRWNEYAHDYR